MSDVTPSNNGSNLNALFQSTMESLTSSAPPSEPAPASQVPTTPAADTQTKNSAQAQAQAVAEEIEFKGKKYRVDKAPKDILLEMLNAKDGMRKAFAERDKLQKSIKDRETDLQRFDQITSALKSKGWEGLYDSVVGKEGAYKEHLKSVEERALRRYNATEEQLKLLDSEERASKEKELRELAERTTKETMEHIQREKDSAAKEVLSNRLTEAFSAVDFEGKLGDPEQEEEFNDYVWEKARKKLKAYAEEKGIGHHEISPKIMKQTFIDIASKLDKNIKSRVDAQVPKTVAAATDAATIAAQAKSVSTPGKKANNLSELYDESKGPTDFVNRLMSMGLY